MMEAPAQSRFSLTLTALRAVLTQREETEIAFQIGAPAGARLAPQKRLRTRTRDTRVASIELMLLCLRKPATVPDSRARCFRL
jgi:hypothetical protein